ncbi:OB-fold domain-containing protein [bacterium]|nr:OB-fold domain-containing protein [bacterium]
MQRIPIHDGLFTDAGALLGARCPDCERWHFPADADCPYCSGERCQTAALSDRGTLCLFTGVNNRPPGYLGEVPFGFGVVELPEGLRLIARLTEADPTKLRAGMAMRLVIVPLHVDDEGREVVSYAFAPDEVA